MVVVAGVVIPSCPITLHISRGSCPRYKREWSVSNIERLLLCDVSSVKNMASMPLRGLIELGGRPLNVFEGF